MLRKILFYLILITTVISISYFTFIYYATYSEGVRSGELIKFSNKGYAFKTWEGEVSQGISGAQIFKFSVLDSKKDVIQGLKDLQGQYVKVNYIERYRTFPWWGDSHYFIISVEKEKSPFNFK